MPNAPYTDNKERILQYIVDYTAEHGIEPTHTDIDTGLQLGYTCGVYIAMLRRDGFLEWAPSIRLPGSQWRTRKEAIKILDMPPQTLDFWRRRGWIKAIQRPNGYHVFPVAEIERILAERAKPPLHFSDLVLDPGWCNWLAGFTDGEGTFSLTPQSNSPGYSHGYALFQRSDHADVLQDIRQRLQVGHLFERLKKGSTGPGTKYYVCRREHLVHVIIPLFETYPLRVKQRAFSIWREAVLLIADGGALDERRPEVVALHDALHEEYKYSPNR